MPCAPGLSSNHEPVSAGCGSPEMLFSSSAASHARSRPVRGGYDGMGEGGTIGAPAAIANALFRCAHARSPFRGFRSCRRGSRRPRAKISWRGYLLG